MPIDASATSFVLHPQLAADTLPVGDVSLSRLLLMNDGRFPWLILVPRRAGLVEILDLSAGERAVLMEEIARASTVLRRMTGAEKLNVAAIGNRVHQLHIHVVARFAADAAWPDPVWGRGVAQPYAGDAGRERAAAIWSAMTFV